MLFSVNNRTSLAISRLVCALSILLIPSFLNFLSLEVSIYLTCTLFIIVAALRVKADSKIYCSIQYSSYAVLLAFGLLSAFWVENKSIHFLYLFAICSVWAFSIVLKDYFAESNTARFKRRLAYFLGFSGTVCALVNIVYWLLYLVPVGADKPFNIGFNSADWLGMFMSVSIVCFGYLIRHNSMLKRFMMVVCSLIMLFVMYMTKSILAWMFLIALLVLVILKFKLKDSKRFIGCAFSLLTLYFAIIIVYFMHTPNGKLFNDVLAHSLNNLFGYGGGFWSGKGCFIGSYKVSATGIGLFLYLINSAGIIGFIICGLIFLRNIIIFVKQKSIISAVALLMLLTIFIVPFEWSLSLILIVAGFNSYNEFCADADFKYAVSDTSKKKFNIVICVIILFTVLNMIFSFMKMNAFSHYKNKEYRRSYEIYSIVSNINFIDSESYKMAALSLLDEKTQIIDKKEEAISLIDNAIKYDIHNLENLEVKAGIYSACRNYELASIQYSELARKALVKDEYNLLQAKALFCIVEENPKGSIKTKRTYEEILKIVDCTENLDYKKEIVDIADRALSYTKGDIENG